MQRSDIMPNRNYQAGRRFEYRVKKHLEKNGWFVVRSAGSKGAFDLVAIKHCSTTVGSDVALIQCKYGSKPSKKERDKLDEIYYDYDMVFGVTIAYAEHYGNIQFLSPKTMKKVSWID